MFIANRYFGVHCLAHVDNLQFKNNKVNSSFFICRGEVKIKDLESVDGLINWLMSLYYTVIWVLGGIVKHLEVLKVIVDILFLNPNPALISFHGSNKTLNLREII